MSDRQSADGQGPAACGRTARTCRARGRAVAVALVAVLGATTGCTGLPTSGPLIEGPRVNDDSAEQIRVVPQGPRPGATPSEVVLGFIRAGADSDTNRAVGRSFLTPGSAGRWQWDNEPIYVYDSADALRLRATGSDTVEATLSPVAIISAQGRYSDLPRGTRQRQVFRTAKVNGEWRVELPEHGFGTWIDSDSLDRTHVSADTTYVTPTNRLLVSDRRWFLNGGSLATSLANAQLEPVPTHLRGAVKTGIPEGTGMLVSAVPVDNNIATVNLAPTALNAEPDQRRAMWAQFAATLYQLPSINGTSLTVQGKPLTVPDVTPPVTTPGALGFREPPESALASAIVRRPTGLFSLDPRDGSGSAAPALGTRTPPVIPNGWGELALSADGVEIAGVGGDGRELSRWRADGRHPVNGFVAEALSRPTYDSTGYLWVSGLEEGSKRGSVWTLALGARPDTRPTRVGAAWLDGRRPVSVSVAADGVRAVVVSTAMDGGDPRIELAGIRRAPNGQPAGLSEPLRLGAPFTLVRGVVWLDNGSLAVLGRTAETEPVRPYVLTLGIGIEGYRRRSGQSTPLMTPTPSAIAITSTGGARGIIVVTDDRKVLARAGGSWRQIATGRDVLLPAR